MRHETLLDGEELPKLVKLKFDREKAMQESRRVSEQLAELRADLHRARVREKYVPVRRPRVEGRYIPAAELVEVRWHLSDKLSALGYEIGRLTSLIYMSDAGKY